jgi:phage I-like protein
MNERVQDRALECQSVGTPEVGEGLKQVRLSPWGKVESTNGDFIVDDEGVREILRTFAERGESLPIDIEHESLPERQPATGSRGAIGWIEKVFAEANRGLFALVKWSDAGKQLIRSDAFRYLSPVFVIRKDDRRVIGLHSAAITTLPAIGKMDRLAASQNAKTETTAMADENARIAQSVRSALGLRKDADADLIVTSITTLKARTGDVAAMETELTALKAQIQSQEVEQWLASYSAKGVVGIGAGDAERKADREMILRLACSNRADCERVLRQRVSMMPPQGRTNQPTSRQMTIIEAERDYRENIGHQKATSLVAFVANALREKGLPKLTEAETSELAVG